MSTLEELHARWLHRPGYRAEYERVGRELAAVDAAVNTVAPLGPVALRRLADAARARAKRIERGDE